MLQVVFRKIADVLREKELAERDLNEPPMDLSTDHRVRRLISRFRKMSCSRLPSVNAALPLSDLSPTDALTVLARDGRKTHSVDASDCTTDGRERPSSDTRNRNCNGGTAVTARRRMLSIDSTDPAAAVTALPSNSVNTRSASEAANVEERVLLCDNMVPRTPRRSRWTSLLSRVVPDTTTTGSAASPAAAADNEVFDVEDLSDGEAATSPRRDVGRSTVEVHVSRQESCSSSCAEDEPRVDTVRHSVDTRHSVVVGSGDGQLTDLRSELRGQLGSVHERLDDVSQRLDVIWRLLANASPQRRPNNLPVGQFR